MATTDTSADFSGDESEWEDEFPEGTVQNLYRLTESSKSKEIPQMNQILKNKNKMKKPQLQLVAAGYR